MPDEKPQQRQIEYRPSPEGVLRVYANNVSMSSTRFDLRILFGEVADISEDKAVVENRVQVTITWLEAKLLGDFITANIKAFEELNGPLKLPNIPQLMIVPQTFPDAK
jgi:hypothetical protein